MREWKQIDTSCICGSFYIIKKNEDWHCNKCGFKRTTDYEICKSKPEILFNQKKRKIVGKTWSKKLHRYVTQADIKAGRV